MDTFLLDKVLEELDEIDEGIQIKTLRAFLFVAHRGSCNQKDVEKALKFTNASASRNISYWTDVTFDRRQGQGFIIRLEDPSDRRFKILTLTKKGKEFYQKLRSI